MKSNYKTLGDYIQEVKARNSDFSAKDLLGINIDKFFMPSVANIVGTDLSTYRIVQKNQFACNRMHVGRDYRIPISLSRRDEPFMVSPAYDVFEIKDTEVLDPEFLMMWFSRAEYDRNAWFYTDADVRGGLPWKSFTDMKFPLPSPHVQKSLVAEYNSIKNRINLNKKLIQELEQTAHAIYKEWFVTNIDPDNLPNGWKMKKLNEICDVINGRAYAEEEFKKEGTPIIRIQNLNGGSIYVYSDLNLDDDKYVYNGDLIFAWSATFGPFIWRGEKSIYHYHIWKLKHHTPELKFLIYYYFKRETTRVSGEGTGSIFTHITKALMESQALLIPHEDLLKKFHGIASIIDTYIEPLTREIQKLEAMKNLLLAKMAST